RSGRWVRQPRSSTSESDTTHGVDPIGYRVHARPAQTGYGGRRTTWVWGRGLDYLSGRSNKSLFAVWTSARTMVLDRGGSVVPRLRSFGIVSARPNRSPLSAFILFIPGIRLRGRGV